MDISYYFNKPIPAVWGKVNIEPSNHCKNGGNEGDIIWKRLQQTEWDWQMLWFLIYGGLKYNWSLVFTNEERETICSLILGHYLIVHIKPLRMMIHLFSLKSYPSHKTKGLHKEKRLNACVILKIKHFIIFCMCKKGKVSKRNSKKKQTCVGLILFM